MRHVIHVMSMNGMLVPNVLDVHRKECYEKHRKANCFCRSEKKPRSKAFEDPSVGSATQRRTRATRATRHSQGPLPWKPQQNGTLLPRLCWRFYGVSIWQAKQLWGQQCVYNAAGKEQKNVQEAVRSLEPTWTNTSNNRNVTGTHG